MKNSEDKMQEKVQKIIDEMRPYIQMHGGDVSFVDIKDGIVKLKVTGACVGCSFSDETFNGMIGGMIKEEIPEIKNIIITNSDVSVGEPTKTSALKIIKIWQTQKNMPATRKVQILAK